MTERLSPWRYVERLKGMVREDPLTGLANRRAFQERMEPALKRLFEARKHGNERPADVISLIAIDIDHFKELNDAFGHGKGDEILKALSELLKRKVRPSDSAARLGGDEFMLGLIGLNMNDSLERAEEIRTEFSEIVTGLHLTWPKEPAPVGLSIGVVSFNPDSAPVSLEEAAGKADAALYAAKERGKNSIVSHTEHLEKDRGHASSE